MSTEIRAIARDASDYPAPLRDLRDAPPKIWVRGELPRGPTVAIVGTRRASPEALAFTEHLARELSRAGVVVISGGAQGIDAAAHRGALERTLVVHATGLDVTFPRSHERLFREILERGGGWLTEAPAGTRGVAWRFLARNRLIAALASIVIVVQAPARSGALSTARAALDLGRTLMATPSAPWDRRGEGTRWLLEQGARWCWCAADVTKLLGLPGIPIEPPPKPAIGGESERVLAALEVAPSHVDGIVERTGLAAARVQIALIELSVAGAVRQDRGVWHAIA